MDWRISYLDMGICPWCKGKLEDALYMVNKEDLPQEIYLDFVDGKANVWWCPNCGVFFVVVPPKVFLLP